MNIHYTVYSIQYTKQHPQLFMVFERRTGKTDTHSNSKPAGGISGIKVLEVVRLSGSGINKVNSACCDLHGNHDKNRAYNFQGGRGIKKKE